MRITDIHATQVIVPLRKEHCQSPEYGDTIFDEGGKWIIEVHTDTGITGYGESRRFEQWEQIQGLFERFRGINLLELSPVLEPIYALENLTRFSSRSKGASNRIWEFEGTGELPVHSTVEMTILDLLGKHYQVPVSFFYGGAVRPSVSAGVWMMRMTPEDSATACEKAVIAGYSGVKFKSMLEDPVKERVAAIRSACGPDFSITVDANERFYRLAEAMPLIGQLENYGNLLLESPFPHHRFGDYRLLRQKTNIPIAMHLKQAGEIYEAAKAEVCDYMNMSVYSGRRFIEAQHILLHAGLRSWCGTGVDLGIREAFYSHLIAASKPCTLISDIYGRWIREHDLLEEPLNIHRGVLTFSTKPGLGIALDHKAMERYAQATLNVAFAS